MRKTAQLRGLDFVEWRADCMGPLPDPLPNFRCPVLLTARDPAEGGRSALPAAARRALLIDGLPRVALVDIEIRNLNRLSGVVAAAREGQVNVVGSFHDFQKTPSLLRLRDQVRRARDAGAHAVKIATAAQDPSDIARLLDILSTSPIPASVMAMGPLGMASRLLFASAGSVLNYGWIDRPNVPGQWAALELRRLLAATGVRP